MYKIINQYIEVYVPEARWRDPTVQHIIDSVTALVGGATVTKVDGLYIRKDGITTDKEQIRVVHWDVSRHDYGEVRRRVSFLVEHLLDLGEECVLRKRLLDGNYKAELIYAQPEGPLQHQPPLPLDAPQPSVN